MTKIFLSILTIVALNTGIAQAGTKCYIFIQAQTGCKNPAPTNVWFEDNYQDSPFNNGRCLLRAREYHQYCNKFDGKSMNVFAAFNLDYTTISAQVVGGPDKIKTYGYQWVELPTR